MVIGHCYHKENVFVKLIYAFHMPFFFIISGILYYSRKETTHFPLKKWFRKLIVPYFFFEFLYDFLLFLLTLLSHNDAVATFRNSLLATLLLIGKSVSWYSPCLFFARIILGSHMLIVEIVRLLDYKLLGNLLYKLGIFEGLVFGSIVMISEIPIIFIMKRYFGFALGNRKG